ncbi:hypothetical protein HID58_094375 [Brassica napus]|uniref:Uncharacterized protein n=1 Tax=Brassica napus TaxID=3708 RepID=A0ABQ7X9Y7_BRANA|nr:hypothetical protein HID58_094375 [Brassica napus]
MGCKPRVTAAALSPRLEVNKCSKYSPITCAISSSLYTIFPSSRSITEKAFLLLRAFVMAWK